MLTFEHSVLSETAGTARPTVCSTETQLDEREAMKCFCCLHMERKCRVRFSFELHSKHKLLHQAVSS